VRRGEIWWASLLIGRDRPLSVDIMMRVDNGLRLVLAL
jgi:hypothetical protein